jgi:hypothetical protein
VVGAIELSRAAYRKMVQNLVWATAYNRVAIPVAAGLLVENKRNQNPPPPRSEQFVFGSERRICSVAPTCKLAKPAAKGTAKFLGSCIKVVDATTLQKIFELESGGQAKKASRLVRCQTGGAIASDRDGFKCLACRLGRCGRSFGNPTVICTAP